MHAWTRAAAAVSILCSLTACGGGGGSSGGAAAGGSSVHAPSSVKAVVGDTQVTLTWSAVASATGYTVYWSLTPGVDPKTANAVSVGTPLFVHSGLTNGQVYSYVVTAHGPWGESKVSDKVAAVPSVTSSAYDPPWAGVAPSQVLTIAYDGGKTTEENGLLLALTIQSLQPGQMLRVGAGIYTMNFGFTVSLQGTAAAPIWIVAAPGATPVIKPSSNSVNVMNVGLPNDGGAEYLVFQGIEFTGGSAGVRFLSCNNVWFDRNLVHDTHDIGVSANSWDCSYLYLTRNEIHHTGGLGEGMYLGGNYGSVILHDSVIALNHVHHTYGTDQGDGIELKQGSYGNWIVGNYVHDTNYPCILVYGTYGKAVNIIERNVCHTSLNEVMQVQGEALVVNNLLVNGLAAFYSADHQATTTNLKVVHNTIVNTGNAAILGQWGGKAGMVFANNACYSQSGLALGFGSGTSGVTVNGNVVFGTSYNVFSGFAAGNGLSDFVGLTWNATQINGLPSPGSALINAGDPAWEALEDISGALRTGTVEAGCYDLP